MQLRTALAFAVVLSFASAQTSVVDAANLALGENVYPSLPFQKTLAATRDGSLFALAQFNVNTTTPELRLYRSSDGGASFQLETRARTPLSGQGAMATGLDGDTLHVAWGFSVSGISSVAYARYDTRARAWLGTDQVLFQGGATANDGYLWPNVDVGPDGNPVVTCTTHRNRAWSGQLRWFDGSAWSPETQINADTYGVFVSVVADRSGDFHCAYRTATGGYGIRYRRFERASASWGSEGEVQVFAGTANVSTLVVDEAGNKHVLYTRNGSLELATAGPGSFVFTSQTIATDSYTIGNVNWMNFALSESDGTIWILYSYQSRNLDEVFARVLAGSTLTPEFSLYRVAGQKHELLSGHARVPHRLGASALFTAEDPATSTRALRAWPHAAGTVPFGAGCPGTGGFVPYLSAVGLPSPGTTGFALTLARARGATAAVLLVGHRDDSFSGVPLPIDLTAAGLTGCVLRTNLLFALSTVTSGANPGEGTAAVTLPIPNDQALLGARIFGQWLVVDGANPAGLVLSGAGAAIVR